MIATDRNLVAHVYNPNNQTKDQLIDGFVVRLKQFKRIYKEIATDTMQYPEQHILLEGNRGMGKTTMLLRLAYQIENDEQLNGWLLPLVFNEEEYGISRLFKLWERIAVLLAEKSSEFQGLFEAMDSRYDRYESTEAYEYDMFALLSKRLTEKGKKVLLFIDNFGDIISKFKKQEVQRLREVLQTSNKIRIIGASSVILEAHYDYRHPFYEFFKIIRLRGLTQPETETLLLKLGKVYKQETIQSIVKNQKGRVEALRRLTGGVIRSIVLIFEIFVDKQAGTAFHDLEAILDKATPLYKHRMDDLPAQQQEIMQTIAMAWDAINTKEIARVTRIPSKTVSAQLRQLEKNELVTKILTSTKNHLYQIKERFFNIWYLMRHGRKGDKNKVLWLVRFLEEWCNKQELEERAVSHIKALKTRAYDIRGAYYMTEALAHTRHISWGTQEKLLQETKKYLKKSNSDFTKYLSNTDNELWEKALQFFKANEKEKALSTLEKIKKDSAFWTGVFFHINIKDYVKAKDYYLDAAKKGQSGALTNLGTLYYNQFNNIEIAKNYYLKAIENEEEDADFNLAVLYSNEIKDYQKAEIHYLKAVDKNSSHAIFNLAFLYQYKLKDFKKAETYYLKAIEKEVFRGYGNLGLLYMNDFKDFKKAEKYLLLGVEKDNENAATNLAALYCNHLNDDEQAEKYMLMAIEKREPDAHFRLGIFYFYNKKLSKPAITHTITAIKKTNNGQAVILLSKILIWNQSIEEALKVLNSIWYDELFIDTFSAKSKSISPIIHLLANKYYTEAHNYFTSEKAKNLNLKDRLKPMYYATLHFLKDKYPDEYLRMGAELKETVEEIIQKVEIIQTTFKDLK